MIRRPIIRKSNSNSPKTTCIATDSNGDSKTNCCEGESWSCLRLGKWKLIMLNMHQSRFKSLCVLFFFFVYSVVNHYKCHVASSRKNLSVGPRKIPRILRYNVISDARNVNEVELINPNTNWTSNNRTIKVKEKDLERQRKVLKNKYSYPEPIADGPDCEVQHDWQTQSFPTCNVLHEHNVIYIASPYHEEITYVNSGGFRDVWKVRSSSNETAALKTLIYGEDYSLDEYEGHRIDAVALDRLSFSPYITDVYAACVNSGLFEFGHGGSLQEMLFGKKPIVLNSREKLIMGYHVAAAVADVHNSDVEGRAAISHTDIKPKQFILVPETGILKLTDFNRARFLAWNKKRKNICPFEFGSNGGKYRAPEEYKFEPETEMIDVFQMGNTLYSILTGITVFHNISTKNVSKIVPKGELPYIDDTYMNSNDPAERALLKSLYMCWEYHAKDRAPARKVEQYLRAAVEKLGLIGKKDI